MYSEQMQNLIAKFRRAINDLDSIYTDEILYGYISDAVDELELGEMSRGVHVSDGDFMASNFPVIIPPKEQTVYLIKSQILYTESMLQASDRETLSYTKNKLSVDTSEQSQNHRETLKVLKEKLAKSLYYANGGASIEGVRVE